MQLIVIIGALTHRLQPVSFKLTVVQRNDTEVPIRVQLQVVDFQPGIGSSPYFHDSLHFAHQLLSLISLLFALLVEHVRILGDRYVQLL
jgi:hypothetical protein